MARINLELTSNQLNDIEEAFNFIGKSEKEINQKDFKLLMIALGFEPTNEEVNKILKENKSPENITLQKAQQMFKQIYFKRNKKDRIAKAYKMICGNAKAIDLECLTNILIEIDEKFSQQEIKELFQEGDLDNDGVIGEKDFISIMEHIDLF